LISIKKEFEMKILVVGSTGVLGRNVIPRLVGRGHAVRAIVRRPEQARFLEQMGVEPRIGDVFDRTSLEGAARGMELALHLATAIPKSGGQDWSLNDRVRREGTHNLLEAAAKSGVKRIILQSITLLYGEKGQKVVDESTPSQVTAVSESSADMEAMLQASDLEWSILRGGIFYGAGTGREDGWRNEARRAQLALPGDGSDLISLVHVVDFARAVVAAAEAGWAGKVYNIVDDEPVSYRRLFNHIAAQLGADPPALGGPRILPSLGCSNGRAKRELAWEPAFPNYLSGLA
jgi:nucleoside-diphosphate-sugar epimerase